MTREISAVTLANGPTLSYSEQGDGSGLALVLLPGPTDSWQSYEPVLERLRISARTIAVSPRGHGDSERPATGYRVQDFAADVVGLLDALGIERAVLAGHSGSCLVARRVAHDAIVGREMQEQLKAQLSRVDLVVYHGVGHTPRWEDPLRFATDVAAFVERLLPVHP